MTAHTADDGYCVAVCPHDLTSKDCGLEVVRPGKFQCWCDRSCDGTGYLHDEGICEGDHRLAEVLRRASDNDTPTPKRRTLKSVLFGRTEAQQ